MRNYVRGDNFSATPNKTQMRIVYFGFDLFADCFRAVVNTKGVEVMALYTFPTDNEFEFNREVVEVAREHNIPVHYEKITPEALEEYFDNGCDFILSAGYIYKIPILNRPEFKGVNIHPALLPIGRGAWPYPCTILKGLKKDGVTLHKIEEGFDTGDILLQGSYRVRRKETLDTLTKKSQKLAVNLVKKLLASFSECWDNAEEQGDGEYWSEPTDKDRTITSEMSVSDAKHLVRAFGSFGVIFEGEVFKNKTKKYKKVPLKNGQIKLFY